MAKHIEITDSMRISRDGPYNAGAARARQEKRADEQHERQLSIAAHRAQTAWSVVFLVVWVCLMLGAAVGAMSLIGKLLFGG